MLNPDDTAFPPITPDEAAEELHQRVRALRGVCDMYLSGDTRWLEVDTNASKLLSAASYWAREAE